MADLKMKSGIELIAEERATHAGRGYDYHHDAEHEVQELVFAAVAYAMPFEETGEGKAKIKRTHFWPWAPKYWKPSPDNRVRELVKAGALIAAEIDRLQNLKTQ